MTRIPRLLLVPLLCSLVWACGFQPLYSSSKSGRLSYRFEGIEIPVRPDREGQILRNLLLDKLVLGQSNAKKVWRLDLDMRIGRSNVAILRDSTSTFAKMRVDVSWVLVSLVDGAPKTRGSVTRTSSFSITSSEFASLQAEKDAKHRAIDAAAEDIRLRLISFLNKRTG